MESENKLIETIKNIFISIIVLSIIILACVLILANMQTEIEKYYKETCDKLNGKLMFYECFNTPANLGFCDLDTTKKGMYCSLENGSEIDLTIRRMIN